ncbi:acyl-CoA synthetase (AMP-forming)/AMP-acid ligase II [Sphingomonas jejuensis]|uniref:Acyl-CoA synthetase (AMP-forming)/AMP-acid ligase II n=1 Tax=Sphingomonas jejuensis TaxID=904715 RepID=A0ABX0XM75_9SPHN|nr:AMP-binding protein [Sphingomonas jejuensis]NJC33967.1 acyl-CoA synthetase (AMP-forming)/AMP-acid ligase II [Sphingomonas jejuensis]
MIIKTVDAVFDPFSVGGVLRSAADRFADRRALRFGDRSATYSQLFDEVVERARGLIGLGVRPGDHVGILMPNCWDYVILYYAANLVGATAVLLNARYRADDLAYVIPQSDVSLLIVGGHARRFTDYRPMLRAIFPELDRWNGGPLSVAAAPALRGLVEIGDDRPGSWPADAAFHAAAGSVAADEVIERAAAVRADSVGMMIFSSGTTSRPKACMLTHRSLALTADALATRFRLTPDDRVWNPLALFHMSTMLPMAACRAAGACFIGMDRFNPDDAMDLLKVERPTVHYAGFPTIISALVTHPGFAAYDQAALRINHVVGPPDLLRRYGELFPGAVAVNSYGLTEATGVPCYSDLDDPEDLLYETSGSLFPGMTARIVDEEGRPVPDGVAGEICLKGFGIFAGYYRDPDATARAVSADGWLHTGDLGRIGPGGRLIYDGRLKDMLKIGGENVAAVELESFLVTHPAVRMAQVIGVPDDRLMEVAAAYIELNPGHSLDQDALIRHCLGSIASYKIPRYVRFVDSWPMSATKVQKFELRRAFVPDGKIDVTAYTRAGA